MRVNQNFTLRNIFGEYLLIPIHANEVGNEIIAFNEVGADIWNLAAQGLSECDIVLKIVQSYNLTNHSVEEMSIIAFVSELCEKGLLSREEN